MLMGFPFDILGTLGNLSKTGQSSVIPTGSGGDAIGADPKWTKTIVDIFDAISKVPVQPKEQFYVEPAIGAVVYCDLAVAVEHSGIYIGNGRIAHREGNGNIKGNGQIVDDYPGTFVSRLDGLNPTRKIYVSCVNKKSLRIFSAYQRAKEALNNPKFRGYGLLNYNCHNFTRYCLTGDDNQ